MYYLVLMVRENMRYLRSALSKNDGFGLQEVLGIAAVLIIASFVLIPGFVGLARTIINEMTAWYNTTVNGVLFPDSSPP